jgi:pimeloyl-ACP methyl ester carboxylesterase
MRLAADVFGQGRPVVCLPWFGLDRSVMAATMEPAFAGCPDWQRIYVDLPGCGDSPAGRESSDGVVDAVANFIAKETRLARVVLAGCSYGGYIAAALARRIPDRIAGLLLVCSGVKIRKEDRDLPDDAGVAEADSWLAAVRTDLHDHLSQALGNRTPEVAQRVAAVLTSSRPCDEVYLQRLRAKGYQVSDEGSETRFVGPTLIVAGRQDRIAGCGDQFRATRFYPQATFAAIAGAGHYLPFERPDIFAALVREWLNLFPTVL